MTADLVEFLRARLDEERAKAEQANDPENFRLDVRFLSDDVKHPMYIGAGRVLAEVDAKRRIIEQLEEATEWYDEHKDAPAGEVTGLYFAVKALALPYADHPDYREEWRP